MAIRHYTTRPEYVIGFTPRSDPLPAPACTQDYLLFWNALTGRDYNALPMRTYLYVWQWAREMADAANEMAVLG